MKKSIFFALMISCSIYSQSAYFIPANSNIPVSATSINSMDVESADVDADGDLDIIIAGEYSRNLLFFNDGTGFFSEDPVRLFPEKNVNDGFPGEDSEDIAFADFDQDGDLDIIFVSEDTIYHELLVNDGNGLFTFIGYEFPASNGNAVAILDLNNDDFPDIIIGNTGQNDVYINNQDLTFIQENNRWPANTEGTQDLKLVDLDHDGDLDIVEGIDQGSNNILINNAGFFTEENNRLPNTGLTLETRKITLGDVNGDDEPDIFVSTVNFIGTAHLQNRLYLNDGNGFFSDATDTHLPVYFRFTLDALFLDYDFDDDLDLITTDFQNPVLSYHSFANDGSGIFTETTSDVFDPFTFTNGVGLHTADFNNDTYPDLYFSNFQETDDILFFSEDALGVNDTNYEDRGMVYPNPASSSITLMCKDIGNEQTESSISIYDVLGNLVLEKNRTVDESQSVEIGSLSNGVYFIITKNNEGMKCHGKFIVDKR